MDEMLSRTFAAPEPLELDVRVAAGSVAVAAEGAEAHVEVVPLDADARERLRDVRVELRGRELIVDAPATLTRFLLRDGPRFEIRITCPSGSSLRAQTAAADVVTEGTLAACTVRSASGGVRIARVERAANVRTASGDVEISLVGESADVRTASGDVAVGRATGSVRADAVSGGITIRDAESDVRAGTVSGAVRIYNAGGSVHARSVSGDVTVAVRPGTDVWLDVSSLSGDTSSELEATETPADGAAAVEIAAKTVSGDVRVLRAAPVETPA